MTIKPEQINSTITLELDSSQISPESLVDAIESFNALLKTVAQSVLGHSDKPHWHVKVQSGSAVMGYQVADKSISPSKANRILKVIQGGLKSLTDGTDLPPDFPADAVRYLYDLGTVNVKNKKNQSPVRIWFRKEPERLNENIVDNAQKIVFAYKELGSLEGRIDTLQKRRHQFVIYEPIWDKAIRCYGNDSFLEEARKNFGKRVEVRGEITYRYDGIPQRIDVEEITTLPDANNLPSIYEVLGILGVSHG